MIANYGTVMNEYNTWPVYIFIIMVLLVSYICTNTHVLPRAPAHTYRSYNMMRLCTDARANTHASLRMPIYKIYRYLSK